MAADTVSLSLPLLPLLPLLQLQLPELLLLLLLLPHFRNVLPSNVTTTTTTTAVFFVVAALLLVWYGFQTEGRRGEGGGGMRGDMFCLVPYV